MESCTQFWKKLSLTKINLKKKSNDQEYTENF